MSSCYGLTSDPFPISAHISCQKASWISRLSPGGIGESLMMSISTDLQKRCIVQGAESMVGIWVYLGQNHGRKIPIRHSSDGFS